MGWLWDLWTGLTNFHYQWPRKDQMKGKSPYTRSGLPPPKLDLQHPDKPKVQVKDRASMGIHLAEERERTRYGMSDPEREWRRKYVMDKRLHPDEPIKVEAVYRQLNPLRRFYRYPMDKLYVVFLEPKLGSYYGTVVRAVAPKMAIGTVFFLGLWYHLKYESKMWHDYIGSWAYMPHHLYQEPRRVEIDQAHPGLRDLALDPPKNKGDYYDFGFKKRLYLRDIGETSRPW